MSEEALGGKIDKMAKPNTSTYYPALTGIRAVAAIMVVLFHAAQETDVSKWPVIFRLPARFALQWHIGVTVFFVLSGFLITVRYAQHIEPSLDWAKRYMQNRFARIYPIYFLLTVVSFLVMWWRPDLLHGRFMWPATYTLQDQLNVVVLNLILLRAYFADIFTIGLPTAWSLTVEETFYVSAPLILMSLKGKLRRLLLFAALFLGIGMLLVVIGSYSALDYGFMDTPRYMLNTTFFGRSAEFLFGIGLALWIAKHPVTNDNKSAYTWLGVAGIMIYMAAIMVFHYLYPINSPNDWSYFQIFGNSFILPIFICALFYGLINEQTVLRRLLETKVFDLLGKSSYVLYLIHLGTFDTLFRAYVSDNELVCLVTYILVSIALYKLVEHPLQKRFRAKPKKISIAQPVQLSESV